MLVNMGFYWQRLFIRKTIDRKICYNQKIWIFTIKQWVEKRGIAIDQYKFFKDQIHNNREDDIKKENMKIDDVDHGYIGDEYKNSIDNISKSRLRDGDLRLIEFWFSDHC